MTAPRKKKSVSGERKTESVKAKEAELETEELIKLIHLVGREGRGRRAGDASHSLVFPNALNESYQITGCVFESVEDSHGAEASQSGHFEPGGCLGDVSASLRPGPGRRWATPPPDSHSGSSADL